MKIKSLCLFFLLLFFGFKWAHSQTSNTQADFSCPGQVTVTYDLNSVQPVDITLYYSHNKCDWMLAQTVTGDLAAQTTGTGKIIIWNNYADHVFFGKFYCKVELECPGVMINGVCWATCNVDMPGTFAVNHEDAGMLYQWGSNVGWSSTDPLTASDGINIWRDLAGTENLWPLEKDPCPEGWRIPTSPEVESLLETTNVTSFWTTENGIYGALITDIATANTMFLPASGFRSFIHDGENLLYAIAGIFWACSASGELGDSFVVDANGINTGGTTRSGAVSVRCVLE